MKLTRLVVAAAAAVSITLAGAGVAQAETGDAQKTEQSGLGGLSSDSGAGDSGAEKGDEKDDDKSEDPEKDKEQDELTQLSSQLITDSAGPLAPLLIGIMPALNSLLSLVDVIVEKLSLIAGPHLMGR